jgi:protoheme IX farnesyltransferase
MSVRAYYRLTKPGIIYGNLFTAASGFLLASRFHIHYALLFATLLGVGLVIASACVFNNIIDRGIDALMERTKKRALVTGEINEHLASFYAIVLGAIGFMVLALHTNLLTTYLGIAAFLDYVILYGLAKRRLMAGTIIGSIAGALPPVAGYTAVTNRLDGGAILLFLILVSWQMPHFYAIAMYRIDDYKKAGLPVLPVKLGMDHAKQQILAYIVAFTLACAGLTVFGYTGYSFLVVALGLGITWFIKGLRPQKNDKTWGKKMFLFSLIVITILSVAIPLGAILP